MLYKRTFYDRDALAHRCSAMHYAISYLVKPQVDESGRTSSVGDAAQRVRRRRQFQVADELAISESAYSPTRMISGLAHKNPYHAHTMTALVGGRGLLQAPHHAFPARLVLSFLPLVLPDIHRHTRS